MGMSDVHTEPFQFGRGWTLNKVTIEMVEPRYMPLDRISARLVALDRRTHRRDAGLDPGTRRRGDESAGRQTEGRDPVHQPDPAVRDPRRSSGRERRSETARSAAPSRPPQLNAERLAMLKAEGVGVTIEPNIGEHGTVFVTGRDQGANAVPSIVLASEHYNLVAKMLQQKIPVKLAVEIQATYNEDDRNTHNVIAEIPGTDNAIKDEIVMVGAHLDSWHTGNRRHRQRRRQRDGDGGDAHPEGAQHPPAPHDSRARCGRVKNRACSDRGRTSPSIWPATRTRPRATSSRSTSISTTAIRRSAASTWKATIRRARS